ncbi:hypothetical protein MNBD_GAMMA09-1964 [hydrothermal vent metagenome]|uniref:Transglutaminase-like domain-containing protein n=1 Tax=hydrothermal vent metagenome TaxID=652676 RepID=A0A3B0YJE8_9ZZZZ
MQKLPALRTFLLTASLTGINFTCLASDRADFQQWMSKETNNFQEYRDKRDKEFTGFLKSQWKEMQRFQGLVRDETPKPVRIPVAPKPPAKPVTPITKAPDFKPVIVKVPVIKPATLPPEIIPDSKPQKTNGTRVQLNFYGQKPVFYYDPALAVTLTRPINEKAMSRIWSDMSKADYEGLLKQLNAQRKPLNLNDWGYALLTNLLAQKVHPNSRNNQAIFTWYLMTKAGYQARIAYDSNYVYLLMPTQQQLFASPYFTFDNIRYYALSFDGVKQKPRRIFTYNGNYPGATKALDMRLNVAMNTARQEKKRKLKFKFNNKDYVIHAAHDAETIRYLKTYPQMDIAMYFNSKVNQSTANPILKQLKPLVDGKTEVEAVNLLLRFVQTSFKYKTDEQQFGIENYLFPEETLHYPFSDCEDRAVFFAWLVHNLLGLEVVGLDFPGHIASAVKFNENVPGDAVTFNGKKYVVADPTYINANAGMTMPAYKNLKPGIISY